MTTGTASRQIADWPEESREAAQLVIDTYGEPNEATPTRLTWHRAGPWKRVIATKAFYRHDFPAPHIDASFAPPSDVVTKLGAAPPVPAGRPLCDRTGTPDRRRGRGRPKRG